MPIVGCRMHRGLVLIRRTGTMSKGNVIVYGGLVLGL